MKTFFLIAAGFLCIPSVFAAFPAENLRLENLSVRYIQFQRPSTQQLLEKTQSVLGAAVAKVSEQELQGNIWGYQFTDMISALEDATYRANRYFAAVKKKETSPRGISLYRIDQLLGELRQSIDRLQVKIRVLR